MVHHGSFGIESGRRGRVHSAAFAAGLVLFGTATAAFASPEQHLAATGSRAPIVQDTSLSGTLVSPGLNGQGVVDLVQFTAFDVSALLEEDFQNDLLPATPRRIATHRYVPGGPITTMNRGQWHTAADGMRVWTVAIDVPDAHAMRIHFDGFQLPAGSRVVVEAADGTTETYEGDGPLHSGSFWSAFVAGESATIQYQAPAGVEGVPQISIDEISHVYRSFHDAAAGDDGILPCEEDVTCHVTDDIARDSVGRMFYEQGGDGFVCTGALLDDFDVQTTKGWLLTADHCINDQDVANTLVVYWFYEALECEGDIPSLTTRPQSFGALVIATDTDTDSSFLRLYEDPNDGQGLAGWTTTTASGDLSCIHHPGGAHKHVAFGAQTGDEPICGDFPGADFYAVEWTLGATESGSSGAPLFNEFNQVVGQYSGQCFTAEPGCDNPEDFNNMFGRFDEFYNQIAPFLTSDGIDDAFEENDTFGEASLITDGFYLLEMQDEDDYYMYVTAAPTELDVSIEFDPTKLNLDLYVRDDDGDIIDQSASLTDPSESVALMLPPGTYVIQVNKESGFVGSYTMTLGLFADCNDNGEPDAQEILEGTADDCNNNGVIDACEIAAGSVFDCNENGQIDACEFAEGFDLFAIAGDEYGRAIARSGMWLAVGAPRHDEGAEDRGAVFMYRQVNENDPNSWEFFQTLQPSFGFAGGFAGDRFGFSVDMEGDRLIVGSPFNDDLGNNVGKVYVYDLLHPLNSEPQWMHTDTIYPTEVNAKARFGYALDMQGPRVLIGAPRDDNPTDRTGAAYMFVDGGIGPGAFNLEKRLIVENGNTGDEFGFSVSLDGDTAIVGGPNGGPLNEGAAWVFIQDDGGVNNWGRVSRIRASDRENGDMFGHSVSLNGDTLAIGSFRESDPGLESGAAYVVGRDVGGAGEWGEIARIKPGDLNEGDWFGYAVRLNGDELLVGAPFADTHSPDGGTIRRFLKDEGGVDAWGEAAPIVMPSIPAGAHVGSAIVAQGARVIVGAETWNEHGRALQIRDFRGHDCNGNGILDLCDVVSGDSNDINENMIPDECEDLPCPEDIDGSGTVDVNDLLALLAEWGTCDEPCDTDFDSNGVVDVNDLLQLLAAWGDC